MAKRKSKQKEVRQAAFLAAYAQTGNLEESSKAAKVGRSCHYAWLEDDAYAERFEDAKEQAIQVLENEARKRAIEGTMQLKFYNGEAIIDPRTGKPYMEYKKSDTLMIFLLKAARPEIYQDRSRVEFDGKMQNSGQVTLYLPSNGRDDDNGTS